MCEVTTDIKTATQPHLPQDFGTIIIVLHGVLYKAEAINVTNERVTICSEEVKTTDCLLVWKDITRQKNIFIIIITCSYWKLVFFFCETHLKCKTHFLPQASPCSEASRIADLLPLTALSLSIQSRRLTGFGVSRNQVRLCKPTTSIKTKQPYPATINSSVLAWNTCLP